jgi:hypothetical protein
MAPVSEIPAEVRRLVREQVGTMDQVEVLMRLHASPTTPLTAAEIQESSRLGPDTVARALEHLLRAGLARHDSATGRWTLQASAEERRAIDALSVMYHQRPVSLVKLIYEQPPAPLKLFSDAFRIRKED